MTISIRPLAHADRSGWDSLFSGYAAFYGVFQTPEMRDRVWGWIFDPTHPVEALVAETAEGALAGLAHFRAMPSPLRATEMGFLDDLFVDPTARGARVGEALIAALEQIAVERGWPAIRWMTADDNYRARSLYDRVARKTLWNLYELKPR